MEPESTAVLVKPEIRDIVVHNGHYYIVIVASIISFAVTQIVKPFIKSKCTADKANAITRAFAVIAGAVIGWSIEQDIIDLWLGAAAGGANAFIVKLIKKKASAHLGVSETPAPASEGAPASEAESEES